jgi:hypothetical protein
MNTASCCSTPKTLFALGDADPKPPPQRFPTRGKIADNLNRSLAHLTKRLGKCRDEAYSYVLTSAKWDRNDECFEQRGCGPNIQGGVMTLCTCKHGMRASRLVDEWRGVWIAGFTSRTLYRGRHWLFYLAKIQCAYESHVDLWMNLGDGAVRAKVAHRNFHGDMYQPKTTNLSGEKRFDPRNYKAPSVRCHDHCPEWNGNLWHADVDYYDSARGGRPAKISPLLVADPRRTFLWSKAKVRFAGDHCRSHLRWTLKDFLRSLRN